MTKLKIDDDLHRRAVACARAMGYSSVEELVSHLLERAIEQRDVLEEDLLRVIRSHHERVDGKGYPDGLKGDEINLSTQIVAIADAYDAMTSARPYRVSLKPEAARSSASSQVAGWRAPPL